MAARGRPRSISADQAIAAATVELLADTGFSGLKIERVADRAGVGKTTIYRRWPTKAELVVAALDLYDEHYEVPDTADVRADALAVLRHGLEHLKASFGRIEATLLAEAAFHPGLADALRGAVERSRAPLRTVLARIGREDDVDLLWGPIYYRVLSSVVDAAVVPADYAEHVLDRIWPTLT